MYTDVCRQHVVDDTTIVVMDVAGAIGVFDVSGQMRVR
jgi:hypothetical protein